MGPGCRRLLEAVVKHRDVGYPEARGEEDRLLKRSHAVEELAEEPAAELEAAALGMETSNAHNCELHLEE